MCSSLIVQFANNKTTMNTKALRQKILDLAIHGKLVPQDPNDEPASVLLERIKAEKERLIKEGKIKRPKRSKAACDKPHYPYELPEGWCWCRLEDIAYVASGSTPDKSSFVSNGIPYIKMYNLRNQNIDFNFKPQFIKEDVHNGKLQRSRTEVGDLIMNIVGPPLGKLALIPPSLPQANFNQAAVLIRPYLHKDIINVYLKAYLEEMTEINSISTKGSAGQVNISLTQSQNMRIPLPPVSEQNRITKKLKHWLSMVDCIDCNKENLHDTIKHAKSKLLDLAIHGKLVPQDPTDEPASELLKRINSKAEIACDNAHYRNLPKGWAIITIESVCENINGLWKGKKEPLVNVGVIRNANFTKDFKLDYSKIEYIDVEQSAFRRRHLKNGDLIVEKSGGSDNHPVGRAILYEGEDAVFSFSNFTMILRIKEGEVLTSRYLFYFLLAEYQKGSMSSMQTQTTGLHNLILEKYLSMSIPLPPFSEQLRITAKIDEVFGIMDAIKASL